MNLNHQIDNNVCILSIEGNLALNSTSAVKQYIKSLLQDGSISALLMDLEKVDVIDSSGIAVIVSALKIMKERQAKFALYHLNKKNIAVFKMTCIDRIVDIYTTKQDALACV